MAASPLPRLVITDCDHGTLVPEEEILQGIVRMDRHQRHDEQSLIEICRDADAIVTQYGRFTRRVQETLTRCKVIARYGVGVDTIDLPAATDKGIIVAYVPDYGTDEVSSHAAALILAMHRQLLPLDQAVKAGKWDFRVGSPISRFAGQTLGIVGLGRIGGMLAEKMRGFRLNLLAADPYRTEWPDWVQNASLAELLEASDIVSLHCPLTAETRHMINATALRRMKPSAILVNTARGGVVDTTAVIQALSEKWIAGAALDVQEAEPMPGGHPLTNLPNLILTPHSAWYSEQSIVECKRKVALSVRAVVEGRLPVAIANPEVVKRLGWAPVS
jgi:D-3-phosphoglycerate dehydrogenase